ncbi:MAG: hypothetical protein O7F70_04400 [Gemmatimonadetes bacterium]|nr:hypothetical protein [Gemmatimonadota bacterium]
MEMTIVHTPQQTGRPGRHAEAGVALVSVLLLSVIALALTGALSTVMLTGMRGTSFARSSEVTYGIAQAGVRATIFQIEAATNPIAAETPMGLETYLTTALGAAGTGTPRPGTAQFAGTLPNGSYTVTLSDPTAGDNMLTLSSVGTDQLTGRTRTLVAMLRSEPVEALNYAMFGNKIEFHNHIKVPYGLVLNTSVYSNGTIQIDRAVSIIGPTQAVNAILPNTGPASGTTSLPNTVLSPAGEQGDPDPMTSVPEAQVVQVIPEPKVQPFPTLDFKAAHDAAIAADRQITATALTTLISNARTYAASLVIPGGDSSVTAMLPAGSYPGSVSAASIPIRVIHYRQIGTVTPVRSIAVPNGTNPDASVPLGSPDGTSTAADGTSLYEIQFVGDPLADTLLYVLSSLTLQEPTTTLLQFQGSLVVNGAVTIHAPTEFLAWHNRTGPKFVPLGQTLYGPVATTLAQAAAGQPYDVIYSNWPAIAANGKVKVDSSGAGLGGPVHIEGGVYTPAESHFHKSDPYESSYAVGSEIADTIHNCQWFSFAYDPRAQLTIGLYSKAAGRVQLQVIRWEDRF